MGLRACAMETASSKERRAILQLAEHLERGESITGVLNHSRFVPKHLREIVRTGIETGQIGRVLEEYISSSRNSRLIWREFFLSLLYPVTILMLALLMLGGFVLLIVPQFKYIFMDFGVELPSMTSFIIILGDWMASFWWLFLMMLAMIPGMWIIHSQTPGRAARVRFLEMIPILGTARKMAAASEFCSRLALMIDCRLTLDQALFCVSKSVRDANLSEMSELLSFRVERGADGEEIARGVPNMMPALTSLFRWARDPKLFAEGLRASSEMFAAQARVRANQFSFFIEPATVVIIAVGAGFVLLALFAPLIKLLNELS